MNKKIMIIAGFDQSLPLFRRELIESWLELGYDVVAAAPGNRVAGQLKEMGVSYRQVPLERAGMDPIKDLRLFFSLISLIRKEKPDLLFLYTIKPVIYGALASIFSRKTTAYALITGLGYAFMAENEGSYLRKLIVFLYRQSLKACRKVFFQNPDDKKIFVKEKIVGEEKTVLVNGSGVNLEHFKQAPLPEGFLSFLMIARLLKEKGVVEYVKASKMLKEKYPGVLFKLVGWVFEDNPTAVNKKQLEEWKNEGCIELYGETEDVRSFLAGCSVYVLPSYREGTPRTVLEAMATGRPVITTDVPGCRETVKDGVNGILVPIKDAEALANAMERFILDDAIIEKMVKESRKMAEEKYDVHKVNLAINRAMGLI